MPLRHPKPSAPRARAVVVAVVVLIVAVALPSTSAVFTATHQTGSSTLTSDGSFPSYPTQVGAAPRFWHRGDEAPSSAASPAAADSTGHTTLLPGTYDGATDGPSTWWKLNETTGATVAVDSSGAVNPGTVTNGGATTAPAWTTAGRRAGAVTLDGVDDTVVGARSAVDTSAGFTVSAWARSGVLGSQRTVVSQDGGVMSGFYLQQLSNDRWAFATFNQDVPYAGNTLVRVMSTAVVADQWTHLLGVFDATAGTISLYVNGVQQGTSVARTVSWKAGGSLVVGRGKFDGGPVDHFKGDVDEVKTWQRALTAGEAEAEYTGEVQAFWRFNEGTGTSATTTFDPTAHNTAAHTTDPTPTTLTLRGTAGWQALGDGSSVLRLPGGLANYADRASLVRTDRSFTVSAWVNPTGAGDDENTIVSQYGTRRNGFALMYGAGTAGRWRFGMVNADTDAASRSTVASDAAPVANDWTHLTGVYDGEKRQVRFYVDGVLQGTNSHPTAWHAAGRFVVGHGLQDGATSDPFTGFVDNLRVHQRALDDDAVRDLMNLRDPDVTPVGFSAGLPGALDGTQQAVTPNRAVAFAGATSLANPTLYTAAEADDFTMETWVRVAAGHEGIIATYANQTTGTTANTSPNGTGGFSNRMAYVDNGGRVTFFVKDPTLGDATLRSPTAITDGQWHHVATSLGAAGMKLYVDGILVGHRPTIKQGEAFSGYWRFGGGRVTSQHPNPPSRQFLTGTLDEMAVHPAQLSDREVARHAFSNF